MCIRDRSLISLVVSVNVKHHVYLLKTKIRIYNYMSHGDITLLLNLSYFLLFFKTEGEKMGESLIALDMIDGLANR